MSMAHKAAIVTGVGPGLGAALCRNLAAAGYAVAGVARGNQVEEGLRAEISADGGTYRHICADVADPASLSTAIAHVEQEQGAASVFIHNASQLVIAPFAELTPERFTQAWQVACLGAMVGAQAVIPGMLSQGGGTIIFTGATASVRGGARFAAFASAKFALRALAQSLAREFGPHGIHVAHVLLDGLIWSERTRQRSNPAQEKCMAPDAIAQQYLNLIAQDRSTWTHELDLRPFGESF